MGRHLTTACLERGDDVVGVFRGGRPAASTGERQVRLDLSDGPAVERLLRDTRPDALFHLAGQSSTSRSWLDPGVTYMDNVVAQAVLFHACSMLPNPPRILVASSSEVYGTPPGGTGPIDEKQPMAPHSPYGVTKAAQELMAAQYRRSHGFHVVVVRPFLTVGPGRSDQFFSGAFARQVVEIERGAQAPVIDAGDLDVVRDMTDVRDVARAAMLALELGCDTSVYNIGSGTATTPRKLLDLMLSLAGVTAEVCSTPDDRRGVEPRTLLADTARLKAVTGWFPSISLARSASDMLADWRSRKTEPT